jgi:hypothetical protein
MTASPSVLALAGEVGGAKIGVWICTAPGRAVDRTRKHRR